MAEPLTVIVMSGASFLEMLLLVVTTFTLGIVYTLVAVATRRVSRNLHPFIFFFSESIANIYGIMIFGASYFRQLLHLPPIGGDVYAEFMLSIMCTYSCQLHYILIAVNRGFAVLWPMKYDLYWSRETIVTCVVLLWIGASCFQIFNLVRWAMGLPGIPFAIYVFFQRLVTLPSLSVYSLAMGWVLVNRLIIARCQKNSGASSALSAASYAKAIDLRIFLYCFLSFLPNCYNLVIRPAVNSFHFQYYAIIRLSSPGLLLFVMSGTVREEMPLKGLLFEPIVKLFGKLRTKKQDQTAVISMQTPSAPKKSIPHPADH